MKALGIILIALPLVSLIIYQAIHLGQVKEMLFAFLIVLISFGIISLGIYLIKKDK